MSIPRVLILLILAWSLAVGGFAEEEEFKQTYRAFGVAMGPGVAGTLDINITRWSTDEEREALILSLVQDGQEKMVDLLRDQEETGWARTQTGRGMRGFPSVRIHYAREFQQPDGKRLVVLVTDRTMSMAELRRGTRSTEYEVSAIVMELEKGEDGEEKGQGTLFLGTKLGVDKEQKKLVVESLGYEPVRLTNIEREQ
jgi:hypothetical protein